ncbi:hypothetical protein [Candidatus Enterococcus mansonii]|uniref:Uncharacterized protein n=1 Tax=Candidatus Enterococcus mansonii TaxID=1834181 RepID=A0A242BYL6_9ENTE|nr:hypothetical protein [Enterococcus sp. 4G2_DIV0659]OTO03041.1 hypothetical protein A5880_003152 [Enterococcus sp. 4G2_DIV0659]
MNIFYCEARLSTIKKKSDAAEILILLRDQESSIRYFAKGSTTKIEPCKNKGRMNSFDYTLITSSNPLLNVTVVLSESEAIDQLWKDRKYYNMKSRD